jgi:hypothetical protein
MELESLAVVSCLPLAPLDPQPGFRWDVGAFRGPLAGLMLDRIAGAAAAAGMHRGCTGDALTLKSRTQRDGMDSPLL